MKDADGFSLIEVIAGLSLFTIGILAIATAQIASVKNIGKSGKEDRDNVALFSFSEKISALDFNDSLLTTGNHNQSDGDYLRYYNIKNHPTVENLKVVEILQRNINHNVEKNLTIYISK